MELGILLDDLRTQQWGIDETGGLVDFDIYSGSGSAGAIRAAHLAKHLFKERGPNKILHSVPVVQLSVDNAPPKTARHPPTFEHSIFAFNRTNLLKLKALFPNKEVRDFLKALIVRRVRASIACSLS